MILAGGPTQWVVAVAGRHEAGAVVLAHRGDLVESVVAVLRAGTACGGDGVQPAERVVVVRGGDAGGDRGQQPVAVVVEAGRRGAVQGLGGHVVIGVVRIGLGDRAVPGDLGDPVARVVAVSQGVGQVRRVVIGVHESLRVLGLVPVRVVAVAVAFDQRAVRLVLGLGLRQPVGEICVRHGVAVALHLASHLAPGGIGVAGQLRGRSVADSALVTVASSPRPS